jgi:hypothetical protein
MGGNGGGGGAGLGTNGRGVIWGMEMVGSVNGDMGSMGRHGIWGKRGSGVGVGQGRSFGVVGGKTVEWRVGGMVSGGAEGELGLVGEGGAFVDGIFVVVFLLEFAAENVVLVEIDVEDLVEIWVV